MTCSLPSNQRAYLKSPNMQLEYILSILSTIKCNIHKSPLQQDVKEIAKTLTKYKDKNGLTNF